MVVVVVESKLSDRLWLSFSLALAKPNKRKREKVNDYSGTIVSERRRWRTHTPGPKRDPLMQRRTRRLRKKMKNHTVSDSDRGWVCERGMGTTESQK